jgi:hypothetical protein
MESGATVVMTAETSAVVVAVLAGVFHSERRTQAAHQLVATTFPHENHDALGVRSLRIHSSRVEAPRMLRTPAGPAFGIRSRERERERGG